MLFYHFFSHFSNKLIGQFKKTVSCIEKKQYRVCSIELRKKKERWKDFTPTLVLPHQGGGNRNDRKSKGIREKEWK
ncbi:MAG: hypothetical protein U9N08_04830 [Candidatus Caldatribacteriota bacterium]|nr:hypothetical protein [Candidatus Caldatribacteriota bacterium]